MLLLKTKLDTSSIHGIGLFSDQLIRKNTIVWEFNPLIDLQLSEEAINCLSESARQQVQKYSYRDAESGLYIFCGDDARFFNHSFDPNCMDITTGPDKNRTVAIRAIRPGEELTCDYSLFDLDLIEGRYQFPAAASHQMHNGR